MKKLPLYLLFLIFVLLGVALGFYIGRYSRPSGPIRNNNSNQLFRTNNFFDSQVANISGQINGVQGNNLVIRNQRGEFQTFSASDRISIITLNNSKQSATSSSSLASLQLNADVLVRLELINGNYQITSIQYINPSPSVPNITKPQPSPSS